MSKISLLSPEAEPRLRCESKDILRVQVEFNWLLSQSNQLTVIKPSASATIHNVIGYFREIDLNLVW